MKLSNSPRSASAAVLVAALVAIWVIHDAQAQEVRAVMMPTCPTSTGPALAPGVEGLPALLGPILASFAGSLVDKGVVELKKVVDPAAVTAGGSFLQSGLYLWEVPPTKEDQEPDLTKAKVRLNPEIGCLVIAVGEFKRGSAS